jgi:hypothetical protein
MKTSNIIRVLTLGCLVFLSAGCANFLASWFGGHPNEKYFGRIDLTTKGAKCESAFRWNASRPSLKFRLDQINASVKPIGANPDWVLGLVFRLDVFDKNKFVTSCQLDRKQMDWEKLYLPEDCLALSIPDDASSVLQTGHSYKFVLTVLQEEKNLRNAKVWMCWVSAGISDSM